MFKVLILLFLLGISACTSQRQVYIPVESKYVEDADLMVNICNKFSNELDAAKLHKAAVAVQSTRVISCFDYNSECDKYNSFIALAIKLSEDGALTNADQNEMREAASALSSAVSEGKMKLRKYYESKK